MSKSTPGALPPDHAPGSEPVEIIKWHDEETQQAPLPLKVARLASDDEMDIWLGERIWRGRALLKGQMSHWLARNTLLAVVDTLMWRAAVRTQVPKPLLVSTEFVTRPPSAGTPPSRCPSAAGHSQCPVAGPVRRRGCTSSTQSPAAGVSPT